MKQVISPWRGQRLQHWGRRLKAGWHNYRAAAVEFAEARAAAHVRPHHRSAASNRGQHSVLSCGPSHAADENVWPVNGRFAPKAALPESRILTKAD